jgi:flagellar M-ring protein FliF
MISSQRSEDAAGSSLAGGGVPGTASNLPRPLPPSSGGRGSVSRKTENVTYQTSRLVRHLKLPQGSVRRISVAILVDQAMHWEGSGANAKRILEPPPADKLMVVRDVVAGVIGLEPERGDQLTVDTLPFDTTLSLPAPPAPATHTQPTQQHNGLPDLGLFIQHLKALPPIWLAAGGCILVVLLVAMEVVVRGLVRKSQQRKRASAEAEAQAIAAAKAQPKLAGAAPATSPAQITEAQQAQEAAELEALQNIRMIPTTRKAEIFKKFISEESKKDPSRVAQLLRAWLNEEAQ